MNDKSENEPRPIKWPGSSEYEDALADILKDQARRTELRDAPAQGSARPRLHPAVPPVLALVSFWLWVFPPAVLDPAVPPIPPVAQEAGLRLEMAIQVNNIRQYVAENGRLPNDLAEVTDGNVALRYVPLGGNLFRLSGQAGDVTVDFNSNEPVEELIGDAIAIVSGGAPSTPSGTPPI
jgi:hypothetical protein